MKAKSAEGFVCYVIHAEVVKVQGKCLPIMAQVKMQFIREYTETWVLLAIDHNII